MNASLPNSNGTGTEDWFQVVYPGTEKNPVVIIDNFFALPDELIALANTEPPFIAQASDYYPGLRKVITGDYAQKSLKKIQPLLTAVFQIPHQQTLDISLSAFSLATTPTHKLRPIQCVPHIDTHDKNQFALVHYLCSEDYGGTAFYRHKNTGYESITDARLQDYFRILKQEVTTGGLPRLGYIQGDTLLFEKIGEIPVKWNRAILYRSNCLHSGNINETVGLSANPNHGRLTANSFIKAT